MPTASTNEGGRLPRPVLAALCLALAGLVSLAGCATMGETTLASTIDAGRLATADELEQRLPALIARPEAAARRELEQAVRRELAQPSYNKAYQARLWGILAESAWLFRDRPLLDQAIAAMQSLDPEEPRLAIARARLAAPDQRLGIIQAALEAKPDAPQGALQLELALLQAEARRFREAAAAFDAAFTQLDPAWVALYRDQRELAYRQKDLPSAFGKAEASWLSQDLVSLEALVGLTLRQSRFLDRYGKDSLDAPEALYRQLATDGLLQASQLPKAGLRAAEAWQSRADGAWFLFSLAARLEGKPELLSAGKEWKASPIPDTALDDPAFRAILGVVQREILNLPDGRNFAPRAGLSTAEFLAALERMRRLYP